MVAVLCRFVSVKDTCFIRSVVDDNTKPFARMGRKAYGSYRDSRATEISRNVRSRLFCVRTRKL
jgi:hypothetical protein